jgi:hypothetical protein
VLGYSKSVRNQPNCIHKIPLWVLYVGENSRKGRVNLYNMWYIIWIANVGLKVWTLNTYLGWKNSIIGLFLLIWGMAMLYRYVLICRSSWSRRFSSYFFAVNLCSAYTNLGWKNWIISPDLGVLGFYNKIVVFPEIRGSRSSLDTVCRNVYTHHWFISSCWSD